MEGREQPFAQASPSTPGCSRPSIMYVPVQCSARRDYSHYGSKLPPFLPSLLDSTLHWYGGRGPPPDPLPNNGRQAPSGTEAWRPLGGIPPVPLQGPPGPVSLRDRPLRGCCSLVRVLRSSVTKTGWSLTELRSYSTPYLVPDSLRTCGASLRPGLRPARLSGEWGQFGAQRLGTSR